MSYHKEELHSMNPSRVPRELISVFSEVMNDQNDGTSDWKTRERYSGKGFY